MLDDGFSIPTDTEKLSSFSFSSNNSINVDVVASTKELDHLPSKNMKKMLKDMWSFSQYQEEEAKTFENIALKSKSKLLLYNDILRKDVV